jgi:hypothetical protein
MILAIVGIGIIGIGVGLALDYLELLELRNEMLRACMKEGLAYPENIKTLTRRQIEAWIENH